MNQAPSLYRLLATYWDRYNAVCAAMDAWDDTDPHTPEREVASEAQRVAGAHLEDATVAICAFLPENPHEARIKAAFLTHLMGENGALDRNWAEALVGSLPGLTLHSARAAS
jgi:hypothetical protein